MPGADPEYYAFWGKVDTTSGGFHRLVYHCLDVAAVGAVLASCRSRWVAAFAEAACVLDASRLYDHFGVGTAQGSWRAALAFAAALRDALPTCSLQLRLGANPVESFTRSSWWLAGFATLCDWLGSNVRWFPFEEKCVDLARYWDRARAQAERAVSEAGLEPRRAKSFGGFGDLFRWDPSPLQQQAATVPIGEGPQLFLLEDLAGSGKTEAALTLVARLMDAGRADGFYFALPTMATANAMHSRVSQVLLRLFDSSLPISYVLAHSGPRLAGSGTGLDAGTLEEQKAPREVAGAETASQTAESWLSDSRKKALLADAGVGTIDQALIGALRSKHNSLRLLGLHGHVLLVDEVHACDEYMNGILEELLRAQAVFGGSAVLLSATLPLHVRERFVNAFQNGLGAALAPTGGSEYPCFTAASRGGVTSVRVVARRDSARNIGVEFIGTATETIEWCAAQANLGRCVAWIRNTVRDALAAFDALVARLGPDRVLVFHARFPLGDRLAIEQDVVGRFGPGSRDDDRAGRVVIATQVMEQSLDVDFDEMVSDLAPIDRLIQRCGRMRRHQRGDRGEAVFRVLAPSWEDEPNSKWPGASFRGTTRVYERLSTLWRTQRVLRHEGHLQFPERARHLIESVFSPDTTDVPESILGRDMAAEGARLEQRAMAGYNRISLDQGYQRVGAQWADDERAPTRLGEAMTLLRLVRSSGSAIGPWCVDASLSPRVQWQLGEATARASQICKGDGDEKIRSQLEQAGAPVLLEPGIRVSHAAVALASRVGCLLVWVGEGAVRMYASGQPGGARSDWLLYQAKLALDDSARLKVVRRMYAIRFGEEPPERRSIEQLRGVEGARVRKMYDAMANQYGVRWSKRNYAIDNWDLSDLTNRCLSAATSCLYGITEAAVLAAGYAPAVGFIHTGKPLSFVYDIADLVKFETVVPVAFRVAARPSPEAERTVRLGCRDIFRSTKLLERLIPLINEVLAAGEFKPPEPSPEQIGPAFLDEQPIGDAGHRG